MLVAIFSENQTGRLLRAKGLDSNYCICAIGFELFFIFLAFGRTWSMILSKHAYRTVSTAFHKTLSLLNLPICIVRWTWKYSMLKEAVKIYYLLFSCIFLWDCLVQVIEMHNHPAIEIYFYHTKNITVAEALRSPSCRMQSFSLAVPGISK